jgi:hypothetical protein
MATEGCHFDLHKGKKWERCQELMQFVGALDVEDADIRVLAHDPPQMAPNTVALQLLRAGLLIRAQFVDLLGVGVVGDVYVHANVEQHH